MKRISIYTLRNNRGLEAQITNYGAKIVSLTVPTKDGSTRDVVLGFKSLQEWQNQETYFNAIIGRVANRIKDGKFTLDGQQYQLPINNGTNSLHGGISGLNEKVWEVVGQSIYSVSLRCRLADGEEGYPGNMDIYVTYQLTKDNSISITYEAKTDKPTICGFTNHAYFNLHGEGFPHVDAHLLLINADEYTPFDDTACPTGQILSVEGTPMDFRKPVLVGDRINDPFFAPGRGIDNNWCLVPAADKANDANDKKQLRHAATVAVSDLTMEVFTTFPGLQVYTGNWVEEHVGKSGQMYHEQNSICLECQNWPDAINHDNFPSPILRPGEIYHEQTVYKFTTDGACKLLDQYADNEEEE